MVQASGVRIGWADLPAGVRDGVVEILGEPVVETVSQVGGFSPGTADRVLTASGRRAFVKAVGSALNEQSPAMHRAEAGVARRLPGGIPTPRLLGVHDDGDWVALVFEDVEGRHPHTPWVDDEVAAVLEALRRLAVPVTGLPSLRVDSEEDFAGWRRIAQDPPPGLDPWVAERLDLLDELAMAGLAALEGDRLVHGDVRADNLLIRPDGSVVVVDWPFGCAGPAWFDTLTLVLNVRLYGGRLDDDVIAAAPEAITGCVAGLGALFADRARRPAPPGLPTLRRFQQDQADIMITWLRDRLRAR
ncbi:aminoglycoside phosphotransferase family protein [Dactylosporangium darangshiense]|uniref:Aminoglycoside phosphotransferase domain-containing protein n=1 Tax=Dactylosporangium darangshiense TaxID=579108 RepID=A0ABP8DS25_9ACTN